MRRAFAGNLGLSPSISSQFTPLQPKIAKRSPIFRVQGQSRSLMLTILRSSLLVLVILSRMSVPICNHFYVRQANSGRITSFKGVPFFLPFVRGDPLYPVA